MVKNSKGISYPIEAHAVGGFIAKVQRRTVVSPTGDTIQSNKVDSISVLHEGSPGLVLHMTAEQVGDVVNLLTFIDRLIKDGEFA